MADDISSENVIKNLNDADSLLDVMIQVEDYLDSLDLFVFANWIDGEIVNGPYVERYWIKLTLKYPYKKMPDPQGGLRLLKYGSKVAYQKSKEKISIEVKTAEDIDTNTGRAKTKEVNIWLVHLKIPRRFVEEIDIEGLDLYSKDSDQLEDVVNANSEGIDSSTGLEGDVPTESAGLPELEI